MDTDTESAEFDAIQSQLQQLEIALKRGKHQRSSEIATTTLQLLEKYVQTNLWRNASELFKWLESTAEKLTKAAISETAPENIIKRVIKTVQEDFVTRKRPVGLSTLLSTQISVESEMSVDYSEEIPELRSDIQSAIWDLLFELESSADNIAEEAEKHIHSNDIVMTLGKSRTVEAFLKRAAKKRTFEVIVAECSPFCHGRELAKSLATSKIQTTLIKDTVILAMMSRVNKVIVGTHTVLANGGLKAIAGSHLIALAAKHYNVPVIVLAPMYKLSPQYPLSADVKITNRFVSPDSLVDYSESDFISQAQIYNPIFDYVPPELISLFIFNIGSHAPSYIYRLLHETYPQL